ncbi:hypothetical protein [Algisphaera agarilytica]|uniref:Uncharacterized protein n=1 Tax=Algisphaera agarilytica TaxID=1385975 RepID=A0A7X0H522_9BACT|nr:hypothetical protein [Algisphaera agarilytica]MBB6429432.1 hypothetical protein [Algisphaera agarilytica]
MSKDEWEFVGTSLQPETFGWIGVVDFSQSRWNRIEGGIAHVTEPLYGQSYKAPIYELLVSNSLRHTVIRFASIEMSPGVHGFWVPAIISDK